MDWSDPTSLLALQAAMSLVMAFASFASLVLTFFYVLFTSRILKANQDLVRQNQSILEAQERPVLTAVPQCTKDHLWIRIYNIGRGPAFIFSCTVELSRPQSPTPPERGDFSVPNIPPSEHFDVGSPMLTSLLSDRKYTQLSVDLSCHDLYGNEFRTARVFDWLFMQRQFQAVGAENIVSTNLVPRLKEESALAKQASVRWWRFRVR